MVLQSPRQRERENERGGREEITARVLAIGGGVQPRAGLSVAMATL